MAAAKIKDAIKKLEDAGLKQSAELLKKKLAEATR
jgi:hypothetical protein